MPDPTVHILAADAISAAGDNIPAAMAAFYAGAQPFAIPSHFPARGLRHGLCAELPHSPGTSRALALLDRLLDRLPPIPGGTPVFLATTVGAIDCLEQTPAGAAPPDCTGILLQAVRQRFGAAPVTLVAAACASGQTAAAMAMRALRRRRCRLALVLALDITSEFVSSGFVSLGAVSPTLTRPYDADRDGLLLGEGAAALLLGVEPASPSGGRLLAAGESCDAAHITAPNLSGTCLAALISRTLDQAGIRPEELGGIIGHGTGTPHNDQSEIAALNLVFPADRRPPPPLVSIKGTTGHTLAATGLLQIVYGREFLRRRLCPPQAGLRRPAAGAEAWVSSMSRPLAAHRLLSLNVGFGGINSALILEGEP